MYIFELTVNGTWLEDLETEELKTEVDSMLRLLTECISDAAVALNLFEAATVAPRTDSFHSPSFEADRRLEREIRQGLESRLPPDLDAEARWQAETEIGDQARIELKRRHWSEGRIPRSYEHRVVFLHAKSFLYALDTIKKSHAILDGLAPKQELGRLLDEFDEAFPSLVAVRDSTHHVEDRIRGRRRKTKIPLQPVSNALVHAPGGALMIGNLNGNRYGGTLGDGGYGEVEVSPDSLRVAQLAVQNILNAFQWRGPAQHLPS